MFRRYIPAALVVLGVLPLLSCGANVCFQGNPPQITRVTPGTIVTGSSSVEVTLFGNNFSDGAVLIFNDGTQLSPTSVTSSQMNFSFSASFFNGVGTIQFHLSDGCRGSSNTVAISVVEHF